MSGLSGSLQLPRPLPVITMSSIPETQRDILELKILKESKKLMDQYATLRSRTEHHLDLIQCDVKKLLVCVRDVRHVKRLSKSPLVELESATSISGVFLELIKKNLMSFLQFSILKRIICDICYSSKELQDRLKAYEESFSNYIKRRVCETHIFQEGRFETFVSCDPEKKVELLIITDENWDNNTPFQKVLDIKEIVSDILDIDNFSLQLVSIETNCLRLCYSLSILIAQAVFPLTEEEWKKLSQHSITKMQCLEHFYTTEDKGTQIICIHYAVEMCNSDVAYPCLTDKFLQMVQHF